MSIYDTGKSFGKYTADMASRALVSMILWGLVTNLIMWIFNLLFFWIPLFYSDKRNAAIERAEEYFKNNCDLLCHNCNYWVPRTPDAVCPVCGVTIDILYLNRVEAQEAGYTDPDKFSHDVIDGKVTSPSAERWKKKAKLLGFTGPSSEDDKGNNTSSQSSKPKGPTPTSPSPTITMSKTNGKVPGKDVYILEGKEGKDRYGVVNPADNNTYEFQEQFREKHKNVRCPECNYGFTHVTKDLGKGTQIRSCNQCGAVFGYDYQLQEAVEGELNRFG